MAELNIELDTRPGDYYVSCRDGDRHALLLGPYDTHAEAKGMVGKGRDLAIKVDSRAWFYGFGTCRVEKRELPRMGKLNDMVSKTGCWPA